MIESDVSPATTLIIPTYNGAGRVGDVLQALAKQEAVPGGFEVLIIDNNSSDGTAQVVAAHPATRALRASGINCQVLSESRQGLTFARICGVLAARGRYVCFLDDDTVPDPAYARAGTHELDSDEQIGILVSRLRPRYETDVPASVARREHLFAINRKLGDERIDWGAAPTMAPTLGAGLWIRREVFLRTVPWQTPEQLIPDRIGNRLISGNDIEIGYLVGRGGYRRVYCPTLGLEHRIPKRRLETVYFLKLITGVVRSAISLDHRYQVRPYTAARRARAVTNLAAALAAIPVLMLRKDGVRETLFVLASRLAELQGPFRKYAQ